MATKPNEEPPHPQMPEGMEELMNMLGQSFRQFNQHRASQVAARDRDQKEAAMLAHGAGERGLGASRSDENIEALVVTGLQYGDGKEITGVALTTHAAISPAAMKCVSLDVFPGLIADPIFHLSLKERVVLCWRILRRRAPKTQVK